MSSTVRLLGSSFQRKCAVRATSVLWKRAALLGLLMLLGGVGVPMGLAQERGTHAGEQRADSLVARGDSLRTAYQLEEAMTTYQRARAQYQKAGVEKGIANTDNEIGILFARGDEYDRAATRLRRAADTYRAADDKAGVAKALNNLAIVQRRQGQYEEARDTYQDVLAVYDEGIGDPADRAFVLNNLGLVHEDLGQYSEALRRFKEGLDIHRTLDDQEGVAKSQHNIADVLLRQGQYKEARTRFQKALEWYRAHDDPSEVASTLDGLGTIHLRREEYEEAHSRYQEALRIRRKLENRSAIAETLDSIGAVYRRQGRFQEAVEMLREALRINQEIGDRASFATNLTKLARLHRDRDSLGQAFETYRKAVRINRDLGRSADVATALYGVGLTYLAAGRPAAADSVLRASIDRTEVLLETTTGADRRDFLATEIDRYHALITALVRTGQPRKALRTLEQSRTRVLAEQLASAQTAAEPDGSVPPIDTLQDALGPNQAAVLYANSDDRLPLTVFVVRTDAVRAREVADSTFVEWIETRFDGALARLRRQEGALLKKAKGVPNDDVLTNVVRLYRHDLSVPPSRQLISSARRDNLSQELHALLIGPIKEELQGAENVLIVPDGALAYLPFETLKNWAGEYLVETSQVQYSPSLRAYYLLDRGERDPTQSSGQKGLLAFGGAVYEPETYAVDTARALSDETVYASASPADRASSARDGRSVSSREGTPDRSSESVEGETRSYRQLGFGPERWRNLGGTLREVRVLGDIVSESTVLVGERASESVLRELSRSGTLADYQALHFATHGFVVPERPALSALVLSEVGATDPGRRTPARSASTPGEGDGSSADGYLNVQEVASLDLNAEFVVLSACETGLGRIYRGSGSVSLAQGFLRAGARSVTVSLWPVYDESTSQFMQAVYRRAWGRDTTWLEAIAETKRAFIEGDHGSRLQAPRFWAPFVYYGQETR